MTSAGVWLALSCARCHTMRARWLGRRGNAAPSVFCERRGGAGASHRLAQSCLPREIWSHVSTYTVGLALICVNFGHLAMMQHWCRHHFRARCLPNTFRPPERGQRTSAGMPAEFSSSAAPFRQYRDPTAPARAYRSEFPVGSRPAAPFHFRLLSLRPIPLPPPSGWRRPYADI